MRTRRRPAAAAAAESDGDADRKRTPARRRKPQANKSSGINEEENTEDDNGKRDNINKTEESNGIRRMKEGNGKRVRLEDELHDSVDYDVIKNNIETHENGDDEGDPATRSEKRRKRRPSAPIETTHVSSDDCINKSKMSGKPLTSLHRARFCEYSPRGVVAICTMEGKRITALDQENRDRGSSYFVAVAREGGEVEMWLVDGSSLTSISSSSSSLSLSSQQQQGNSNASSRRNHKRKISKTQNGHDRTSRKAISKLVNRVWTKDSADISQIVFMSSERSNTKERIADRTDNNNTKIVYSPPFTHNLLIASTLSGDLCCWRLDCHLQNSSSEAKTNNAGYSLSRVTFDACGGAIWGLALYDMPTTLVLAADRNNANIKENGGDVGSDDDEQEVRGVSMTVSDKEHTIGLVAAACDDGALRIFRASDSEAACFKLLMRMPRVKGKALCCSWLPSRGKGEGDDGVRIFVVVGTSEGIVHVWDFHTQQELTRITAGTSVTLKDATNGIDLSDNPLCIWSVAPVDNGLGGENDMTIILGTSDGSTTIWDAQYGTMIATFKQHDAAVVSVVSATDQDGNVKVFSTGVDNTICAFTIVGHEDGLASHDLLDDGTLEKSNSAREKIRRRWVYLGYQRPHSHQVRSLNVAPITLDDKIDSVIFSGGAEGCVYMSSCQNFLDKGPISMCWMPTPPVITTVDGPYKSAKSSYGGGELLMCQHQTSLDIWQLGLVENQSNESSAREGDPVSLLEAPVHLARIRSSRTIIASAISCNGSTIAYSDTEGCRVLLIEYDKPTSGSTASYANGTEEKDTYSLRIKKIYKHSSLASVPPAKYLSLPPSKHHSQILLTMMFDGSVWVIDLQDSGELMHVFYDYLGTSTLNHMDLSHHDMATNGLGNHEHNTTSNSPMPCPITATASKCGQWMAIASQPSLDRFLPSYTNTYEKSDENLSQACSSPEETFRISILSLDVLDYKVIHLSNAVAISSMSFTCDGAILAVATLSHEIYFYNVESGKLCTSISDIPTGIFSLKGMCLSAKNDSNIEYERTTENAITTMTKRNMSTVVNGMCFCPASSSLSLLMYTSDSIIYKNFSLAIDQGVMSPNSNTDERRKNRSANERILPLEHPCLLVQFLSDQNALLVERPWREALSSLDPSTLAVSQHRYGKA